MSFSFFFFQAEDGIRDLVRSRGLGDVYKRQYLHAQASASSIAPAETLPPMSQYVDAAHGVGLNLSLIHI